MIKLINISQQWRKLTAILLLLNFAAAPLIYAFPEEECNAACEINPSVHDCNTDAADKMEENCCDMMEINSNETSAFSTACEMQLSDISCDLVVNKVVGTTYIIPKTIDNKVEFVQLTTIDLQNYNSNIELFDLIQEFSFEKKPPIYLTISSFLN